MRSPVSDLSVRIIELGRFFLVATDRRYAVAIVHSVQKTIVDRHGICPVFCNGRIEDALKAAFGPSLIKKVRSSRLTSNR